MAVFGLVFGVQAIPAFLSDMAAVEPAWNAIVASAVFLSLLVAAVLSLLRIATRVAHGAVAVVYVVALATWPIAAVDDPAPHSGPLWLYLLLHVATGNAAMALGQRPATAYLFAVSALCAVVRMTPAGGSAPPNVALLEAGYSLILGGAILIVIVLLRKASMAVDLAQSTAFESYALAVRQHATEVERVEVDAIVHDSVLTTLLSAARASSPEAKALSAVMAHNAIGHLRAAALVVPEDGSRVELSALSARVVDAARSMTVHFELRTRALAPLSIPVQAADAVEAAAVQAMLNSIQHASSAPAVARWVSIRSVTGSGIEVEVGDTGPGFSFADVPAERLGLRVSIIERVANAGGIVSVDAEVGEGTVITVRWPRPAAPITPATLVTA